MNTRDGAAARRACAQAGGEERRCCQKKSTTAARCAHPSASARNGVKQRECPHKGKTGATRGGTHGQAVRRGRVRSVVKNVEGGSGENEKPGREKAEHIAAGKKPQTFPQHHRQEEPGSQSKTSRRKRVGRPACSPLKKNAHWRQRGGGGKSWERRIGEESWEGGREKGEAGREKRGKRQCQGCVWYSGRGGGHERERGASVHTRRGARGEGLARVPKVGREGGRRRRRRRRRYIRTAIHTPNDIEKG